MNSSRTLVQVSQQVVTLALLLLVSIFGYFIMILSKCPYIYLTLPAMIVVEQYLSLPIIIIVSILDEQLLNIPAGMLIATNTMIILICRYLKYNSKRK